MAQYFASGALTNTRTRGFPTGFGDGILVDDFTSSVARGVGENVWRISAPLNANRDETELEFENVGSVSGLGEILIKYRLMSGDADAMNQHRDAPLRIRLGSSSQYVVVAPSDVNWTRKRTIQMFYSSGIRAFSRLDGSIFTFSSSGAFGSADPSPQKPRYVRVGWSIGAGRSPDQTTPASTIVRVKMWNADEAEPSSSSFYDGIYIGAGIPQILLNSTPMLLDFHWAGFSDDGFGDAYKEDIPANDPTTFPGGNKTITIDDAEANARVRLYHQATGNLIDSKVANASGEVSFEVATDELCYAIVTGATADTSRNFLNKGS